jgi:2-polyprenyl-3-methyl-5-hydroxy-6-metoxy-1,4-benzoquinol methylase
MSIVKYDYKKSEKLREEIASIAELTSNAFEDFKETPLPAFIETFTTTVLGMEFIDTVRMLHPHSEILDIGVGFGQSSMYLSSQGHVVTSVEPSADYCRFLEYFSNKYDLGVEIHECSIEAFASKKKFDACIFNSSFHHCEDPRATLLKCRELLKENGRLFLINENVLKFFRSKKWYYRALQKNPEYMGHYGGNEHIYRHHEYVALIKQAGFGRAIENIPVYYKALRPLFRMNIDQKEGDRFKFDEPHLVARFVWYYLMSRIVGNRVLAAIAKNLSLVVCTFIAVKGKG